MTRAVSARSSETKEGDRFLEKGFAKSARVPSVDSDLSGAMHSTEMFSGPLVKQTVAVRRARLLQTDAAETETSAQAL